MEATDPSTLQWIALILMGVLFVGASSQLRNLWRGTTRGLREPELSQWWPFGSILGSAFVRTMHLAVLLGGGIVFLVFSDILQDHFPGEAWRVSCHRGFHDSGSRRPLGQCCSVQPTEMGGPSIPPRPTWCPLRAMAAAESP